MLLGAGFIVTPPATARQAEYWAKDYKVCRDDGSAFLIVPESKYRMS